MKRIAPLMFSAVLGLGAASYVHAVINKTSIHNSNPTHQDQIRLDHFDDDPFFQPNNDVFQEIEKMNQAMRRLMNSQFDRMYNSIDNGLPSLSLSGSTNIEVNESKNKIIYKVKLPQGSDNKVDVAAKNGRLMITSNVAQKITREQDNSKSVSYSQSSNTQSFQIPKAYDEKSLNTKMKGSNLIITLDKK